MFRLNQSSTVELMRFNDCSVQWVSEIKWSYEQMNNFGKGLNLVEIKTEIKIFFSPTILIVERVIRVVVIFIVVGG